MRARADLLDLVGPLGLDGDPGSSHLSHGLPAALGQVESDGPVAAQVAAVAASQEGSEGRRGGRVGGDVSHGTRVLKENSSKSQVQFRNVLQARPERTISNFGRALECWGITFFF